MIWKSLKGGYFLLELANRAEFLILKALHGPSHFIQHQICVGHGGGGCHNFERGTESPEMFAWFLIINQVTVDCTQVFYKHTDLAKMAILVSKKMLPQ